MAKRRAARISLAGRVSPRDTKEDVRSVVLAQPHRRGNTDQRCATAFGRFCLRNNLSQSAHDAGEHYAAVARKWAALKGIRVLGSDPGGGSLVAINDDTVRAVTSAFVGMEKAAFAATLQGYLALRQLVLMDEGVGMDEDGPAIDALTAIAVHLGFLTASGSAYTASAA